jgi:hypothetical protein
MGMQNPRAFFSQVLIQKEKKEKNNKKENPNIFSLPVWCFFLPETCYHAVMKILGE